jgi:hypothetical protein
MTCAVCRARCAPYVDMHNRILQRPAYFQGADDLCGPRCSLAWYQRRREAQ